MKTLNYKTFVTCLIGMLVLFSSCQKDEIKEEEEKGFKIETECSIDGVDIPVTKAENEKGWTTGDGIYHRGDNVVLTANAKSGYELVTFYDKANPSRNVGSPYSFKAQETATYKAEFRSTAPTTYCINCSITGQGSVSGTGCGKTNGTYTLTANPSPGWSPSWTTKQVTVNGGDVNTSVTFTKVDTKKEFWVDCYTDMNQAETYLQVHVTPTAIETVYITVQFEYQYKTSSGEIRSGSESYDLQIASGDSSASMNINSYGKGDFVSASARITRVAGNSTSGDYVYHY